MTHFFSIIDKAAITINQNDYPNILFVNLTLKIKGDILWKFTTVVKINITNVLDSATYVCDLNVFNDKFKWLPIKINNTKNKNTCNIIYFK